MIKSSVQKLWREKMQISIYSPVCTLWMMLWHHSLYSEFLLASLSIEVSKVAYKPNGGLGTTWGLLYNNISKQTTLLSKLKGLTRAVLTYDIFKSGHDSDFWLISS